MAGYCDLGCYACDCTCREVGTHPSCRYCKNCKAYDFHAKKQDNKN